MKRSFVSVFFKACTVTLLFSVFMPTQLFAQTYVCNSDLTMNALGEAPHYINEPITIQLTLEAQEVSNGTTDGILNILSFDYKPDCAEGTDFLSCSSGGNNVAISTPDASIGGSCGADFTTATSDGGLTYVFTPAAPIALNPTETCTVEFDIMVTGVAPGITDIFETSGWAESQIGCTEQDGTDYPPLVASATASSLVIPMSAQRVAFVVTKDFTDDGTGDAEVHIRCNAGLPLAQDFTLKDGGSVSFTVKDFNAGELDCQIWEDPISNYTATYEASAISGNAIVSSDLDGCYYDEVEGGDFLCAITNDAGPGTYTVNKEWILGESGDEGLQLMAPVTIFCDSEILEDDAQNADDAWYVMRNLVGQTDSVTISVDASGGTAQCETIEGNMPTSVTVDNGCRTLMDVVSGEETSCDITNTMFFEGIPTLSQYGLVLLALLTFGIGMVGFRRYS